MSEHYITDRVIMNKVELREEWGRRKEEERGGGGRR